MSEAQSGERSIFYTSHLQQEQLPPHMQEGAFYRLESINYLEGHSDRLRSAMQVDCERMDRYRSATEASGAPFDGADMQQYYNESARAAEVLGNIEGATPADRRATADYIRDTIIPATEALIALSQRDVDDEKKQGKSWDNPHLHFAAWRHEGFLYDSQATVNELLHGLSEETE